MRRAVLLLAAGAALLGCGDDSVIPPVNPEAGQVRLEVGGQPCSGSVIWAVGPVENPSAPFGDNEAFPWSLSMDAIPGQDVSLGACSLCLVVCPGGPCDATITASIYWEGALLETASATGPQGIGCAPAVSVQATIH